MLIPAFNAAETLREAVSSVLDQAFDAPLEVLIIASGTDDSTLELSASIASVHHEVRVLTSAPRLSAARARNIGLATAHYDLIATVDADDELVRSGEGPSYLATAYAMMRNEPFDLVHSDIVIFGAADRVHRFPRQFDEAHFLEHCDIWTPAVFRRDDALAAGGYDETLTCVEDFAFWCSMLRWRKAQGGPLRVGRIHEPLYRYRHWDPLKKVSSGSLTRANHRLGWELVVPRFTDLYEEHFPDVEPSALPDHFSKLEESRLGVTTQLR